MLDITIAIAATLIIFSFGFVGRNKKRRWEIDKKMKFKEYK